MIPPIGGGVAAKLQTHWANNADNGLFWRNGSALWRNGRASVRWLIDAALHGVMLASVLAAGPLLAVLTLRSAATPT